MKPESIGSIKEYLSLLQTALQTPSLPARDIVAEVQDHLLETRERLMAAGFVPSQAEREAITRFGSPDDFVAGLECQRNFSEEDTREMRWTKVLVTLLAAFTSLIALVGLAFTLFINLGIEPSLVIQRGIFYLAVVSQGALTTQHFWISRPSRLSHRILFAGALAFIGIGSIGTLGPNGVGLVGATQDPEYYIGVLAMAMLLQGILTIWSVSRRVIQEA